MSTQPFSSDSLDELLDRTLQEDIGSGDVTTEATVPPESRARAVFIAKQSGILAGLEVARRLFARVGESIDVSFDRDDGSSVETGSTFGTVDGPVRTLLTVERSLLNIMQRMSGIATATRQMVEAAAPYPATILDTRKTAPGLRPLDKWAVRLGGGTNHRHGLYDMVLIKENHIDTVGGVREAIEAVYQHLEDNDLDLPVEIETRTLEEVRNAVRTGGLDRILLDNMVTVSPDGSIDTSMLEEALAIIDNRVPAEVSGNVTLETVPAIAATGVAYISSGALTHSVTATDISLLMDLQEGL
jgi:nicotinate-nucleotide pyrophosphorylase (carboxylating)